MKISERHLKLSLTCQIYKHMILRCSKVVGWKRHGVSLKVSIYLCVVCVNLNNVASLVMLFKCHAVC